MLRICGKYATDGTEYSPENLRFSVLRSQVAAWEDLLDSETDDPVIEFEHGSLRVVFHLATAVYLALVSDIESLKRQELDDLHRPERVTWYHRLIKEAREGKIEYSIEAEGQELVRLDSTVEKLPLKRQSNTLKQLTTILTGKITNAGGTTPNIHIHTLHGDYIVKVDEATLGSLQENIIYKDRAMRVTYTYNLETGERSNYKFKEFIPHRTCTPDTMSDLIEQCTQAYADVVDHVAWVRNLRGESES